METNITLNQILISDPIIDRVRDNSEYDIDYLIKFRKLYNNRNPNINNHVKSKKCFNNNGRIVTAGYSLHKNIPTSINYPISVGECYTENNNKMQKNGKQVYFIRDGRHRMVYAILNKINTITVIIS